MKCLLMLTLCLSAVQAHYVTVERTTNASHVPTAGESRVIQGYPAINGQFPHMVFFRCGGSLISSMWVLTAAHCVDPISKATVFMGDVKLDSSPVAIEVTKFHIHPEYHVVGLRNDIALIEFDSPVTFTGNIKPIRIGNSQDELFVGEVATISGFGDINDDKERPGILLYVHLRVMSNEECRVYFAGVRDYEMCGYGIENPYQGICFGDSGSGLILRRPGEDLLIGVTYSSSINCEDIYPSRFVRPNFFFNWIRETTGLDI